MDDQSLRNCREVAKSWQDCIDNRNILWNKIANKNNGTASFYKACKNGHFKIAKMLIRKAKEFKIDVNAKGRFYKTPFHWVCENGNFDIAEMLIKNSFEFNINLNARDKNKRTSFILACERGHLRVARTYV